MVKQFVARVQNARGVRFNVFTTSDDRYYLFDPLDQDGCSLCQQWPVLRATLSREMRRALGASKGNVDEAEWAQERNRRHAVPNESQVHISRIRRSATGSAGGRAERRGVHSPVHQRGAARGE
jgi:hypothetical protein